MRHKLFIFIFLLVCLPFGSILAQPGDPGGDPDQPVPFTGIEWLLLAGAGLGAGKLVSKAKKDT